MTSKVEKLLDPITKLVSLISKDKVKSLARKLQKIGVAKSESVFNDVLTTPQALAFAKELVDVWKQSEISAKELSYMLLTASHVSAVQQKSQSSELVWTGPVTPFVSTRRTEQALLEVITSAEKSLFLTSFVAYKVPSILKALTESAAKGVRIIILLESSKDFGGSLDSDLIAATKKALPSCEFAYWAVKEEEFEGGKVHAKIVLADEGLCLITSANITQHAMEKNIEVGVLLNGGSLVQNLSCHLRHLLDLKIIQLVEK